MVSRLTRSAASSVPGTSRPNPTSRAAESTRSEASAPLARRVHQIGPKQKPGAAGEMFTVYLEAVTTSGMAVI